MLRVQGETQTLTARKLDGLDPAELQAVEALTITMAQEELGGTFESSVDEWRSGPGETVLGLSFFDGDDPCGLVLLKRPPKSPEWVTPNDISLHGLKITTSHQGRGYGRTAFELAVEAAKQRWPEASGLVLAVDAGNEPALSVYRGYGMADSGPIYRGRIGYEHRLALAFPRAVQELEK
ncbi:N-acetyltransferase [Roseovarius sp. EL26]|uniref:GNAT family N-acetyltransferase n=1 Tax=Roseovarius sp. EL26 TaxID=2126672 RepID=UPI000EA2C8E7|nr:GNAT family N-acetyltransferase [Roseovarius sp. EL26]